MELSIDNKSLRKTEIVKHTYLPKWNEDFTVLVTQTSEIIFRVLDRSSFLKDSIIGERSVNLGQILEHYNGRCENLELNMDLLGTLKPDGRSKSGELVVVLNGLKIDNMVITTPLHHANGINNSVAASANNSMNCASSDVVAIAANTNIRSTILCGGVRARMRLRSTPSNSSTTSLNHSAGDVTFFGPNTLTDMRSGRLPPNESINRRHNEYSEQQVQHTGSRPATNMLPVTACGTNNLNRNSGANWDQSQQPLIPCNGISPNQRSFMVNT